MDIQTFINNYYEAFSLKAELPIAFWYSDSLLGELKQTQGCLFKALPAIRQGKIISMNGDSVGCGGGKFYTGFTPMPEHVPNFVSLKERYKQTPEMVVEGIKGMNVQRSSLPYLHFARIDRLTSFEKVEGLLFLATPDILSGLITWTFSTTIIWMPSPHHLVPVAAPPSRSLSTKIDKEVTARSLVSSIPRSDHMWKATY